MPNNRMISEPAAKERPAGDQVNEDHAQKCDHGPDRQLDTAGDDDEGLPDREHAEQADQVGRI